MKNLRKNRTRCNNQRSKLISESETVLITTDYRETLFLNTDDRTIKDGPYNRRFIDESIKIIDQFI